MKTSNSIIKNGELPNVLGQMIQKMKDDFPEHDRRFPYPDDMSIQRQMEYYIMQPKTFFLCSNKFPIVLKKEVL